MCEECKSCPIKVLCDKVDTIIDETLSFDDIHDILMAIYEKGRADVIDEIEEKLNNTGAKIIFDLPVEEILGEDIDLDDFAMLVQEAVQVYKKMVLGVLKQLKEQKND